MNRLSDVEVTKRPFSLRLRWQDGRVETADLSGLIAASRHFRRFLDDPKVFQTVKVVNWGHGVAWENGLDYSAENLKRLVEEETDDEGADDLRAFKERFNLTNEQVGAVLGYGKSQIKNFKSGYQIPDAARIAIRAMVNDPVVLYARMAKSGAANVALKKHGVAGTKAAGTKVATRVGGKKAPSSTGKVHAARTKKAGRSKTQASA